MQLTNAPGSVGGRFYAGNPFIGLAATVVDAPVMNAVTWEIVNVITGTGRALNGGSETQLREAIQTMIDGAAGGLASGDRLTLDAVFPHGGEPGMLRSGTTRFVASTSTPGLEITGTTASTKHHRVTELRIPARRLSYGAEIELFATGTISNATPTVNPGLGMKAFFDGNILRPAGSLGAQGWLLANGTIGKHRLSRVPVDSRWIARVSLIFLGEYAVAHAGKPYLGGSAQVLSRGRLEVLDLIPGHGLRAGTLAASLGGFWVSGLTYTPGDVVEHYGKTYTCYTEHTAGATNEPGAGTDGSIGTWPRFWTESILTYEVCGAHTIDYLDPLDDHVVEMQIGGPVYQDLETPDHGNWSSGAGTYNEGDQVTNTAGNGERYSCTTQHTAAADKEPGVSTGWQQYWLYTGDDDGAATDRIHVDLARIAIIREGAAGFESGSF